MAKSKKPMSPAMAEMAEMAEGCAATSADVATLERENLSPVRPINLPKVQLETILIPIQGDTELICHAWSKKAKMMMLAKQMGKPSSGREKKEPSVARMFRKFLGLSSLGGDLERVNMASHAKGG